MCFTTQDLVSPACPPLRKFEVPMPHGTWSSLDLCAPKPCLTTGMQDCSPSGIWCLRLCRPVITQTLYIPSHMAPRAEQVCACLSTQLHGNSTSTTQYSFTHLTPSYCDAHPVISFLKR